MTLKNSTNNEKLGWSSDPNTPKDVLVELFKDGNSEVRHMVAMNSNTPENILRDSIKDKDWYVRCGVAHNTKASADILVIIFEQEKSLKSPNMWVMKALYHNANFPEFAKRVLETLYGDLVL